VLRAEASIRGSKIVSGCQISAISFRFFHTPAERPAANAAPSAVVSLLRGRTSGIPRRSAWNCMRKPFTDAPPSTRIDFRDLPASASIASTRSRVW